MRRKEEALLGKNGEKMKRKLIGLIFIYVFSLVVGGLAAGMLSIPFIAETQISVWRHAFFLGVITLAYSALIAPVIAIFHVMVWRFLPNLYLQKFYPVFAYAIFGVSHFLSGFTFFSSRYWPIKIGSINSDHIIVLAMGAALSGSTAIYANIGLEKIKNYYTRNQT